MTDALSAELLKLRKRPATWVVLAILVAFILLFGYVLLWLLATNAPEEAFSGGPPPAELLETLRPGGLTAYAASNVTGVGGALVLVLGALVAGSEYGWGTVRTIAVVRPARVTIALAKVGAVTVAAAALSLAGFAAAGAGAGIVAAAEGMSGWPGAWEVVRALGASWLVLTAWGQLGLGLGFLTRNTGIAVGIGLVYLLVLESLATLLPDTLEAVRVGRDALLGVNANALVARFGEAGADLGAGAGSAAIDPVQAALVVSVYAVGLAAVSVVTFARRELVCRLVTVLRRSRARRPAGGRPPGPVPPDGRSGHGGRGADRSERPPRPAPRSPALRPRRRRGRSRRPPTPRPPPNPSGSARAAGPGPVRSMCPL